MLTTPVREAVRPIRRWDHDPSEFWEAIQRIEAELRYDPTCSAEYLSYPGCPVRTSATGKGLAAETRVSLLRLLPQLPFLLPGLEHLMKTSGAEAIARVNHYLEFFERVEQQIDLREFPLDENAGMETYSVQADARSRAMLLKSEIVLIIAQFELLRQGYLARRRDHASARFKVAA